MRFKTVAVLALTVALAACGDSNAPTKIWEATGFQNPESALADTATDTIYVSNVAGGPGDRDGNGYISKLTLDGKATAEKWVTGLDAPKGLALSGGKLYVADLDKLVEIDVASGTIVTKHEAPGAKILNDVTVDGEGRVYIVRLAGQRHLAARRRHLREVARSRQAGRPERPDRRGR